MATPINDFQDILDAMERNPTLRDALRRHILTDELLQMPVRLERVEEDISTLKEDVSTLKEDVSTLRRTSAPSRRTLAPSRRTLAPSRRTLAPSRRTSPRSAVTSATSRGAITSPTSPHTSTGSAAGTQNQRHRVLHPEEQATSHRTARQSRKAG